MPRNRLIAPNTTACRYFNEDLFPSLKSGGSKYDASATSLISWDPKTPVLLRMEKDGPASCPPIMVQDFFRNVVEKHGEKIAIKYKDDKNNIVSITYNVRE